MKKFCLFFFCFIALFLQAAPSENAEEKNIPVMTPTEIVSSPFPHYFMRMLLSLAALLGLLILTVWTLKRLMKNRDRYINEQKRIKILEKRVLSSKSLLYLIEVDGKKSLIAESHLEIRSIHALDDDPKME